MQQNLREGEVEQILPAKAKLMAENDGWTLIDVRPYPDYCESHAWGAKNAQLYAPLEVNTLDPSSKPRHPRAFPGASATPTPPSNPTICSWTRCKTRWSGEAR